MKRLFSYLLIVFFVFSINIYVKADEDYFACTKDELARVKELAKYVEVNYEYELKEVKQNDKTIKYPVFKLVATNLNSDLKVLIVDDNTNGNYREFKNGDNTTAVLDGFKEGQKVNITIKAYTANDCNGKTVGSRVVKLPYYNNYSETEDCFSFPDYKNCSLFVDHIINEETFKNGFVEYFDSLQKNEVISEENNNWSLLIIIGGIITGLLIVLIVIKIIIKIRKKNDL